MAESQVNEEKEKEQIEHSDGASGQSLTLNFANVDLSKRGAFRVTVAGDTIGYVAWTNDVLDLSGLVHQFENSVPQAKNAIHSLGCLTTEVEGEVILPIYLRADQDIYIERKIMFVDITKRRLYVSDRIG